MKFDTGIICGSFDLIHPGYILMFKDAKTVCEKLVVALQDDPTIDRPHKNKPVQNLNDRKEVLESIKHVDSVLVYNTEADLYSLLQNTKYDVRVLGSDYRDKEYTGKNLDPAVYFHERNHEYSLTSLKESIFLEMLRDKNRKQDIDYG